MKTEYYIHQLDLLKEYIGYYLEMKYNIHIEREPVKVPFLQGLNNYLGGIKLEINDPNNILKDQEWIIEDQFIEDQFIETKILRSFEPLPFKEIIKMKNDLTVYQFKCVIKKVIDKIK